MRPYEPCAFMQLPETSGLTSRRDELLLISANYIMVETWPWSWARLIRTAAVTTRVPSRRPYHATKAAHANEHPRFLLNDLDLYMERINRQITKFTHLPKRVYSIHLTCPHEYLPHQPSHPGSQLSSNVTNFGPATTRVFFFFVSTVNRKTKRDSQINREPMGQNNTEKNVSGAWASVSYLVREFATTWFGIHTLKTSHPPERGKLYKLCPNFRSQTCLEAWHSNP